MSRVNRLLKLQSIFYREGHIGGSKVKKMYPFRPEQGKHLANQVLGNNEATAVVRSNDNNSNHFLKEVLLPYATMQTEAVLR